MTVIAVDTGNKLIKTAHAEPFSAGLNRHGRLRPAINVNRIQYEGNYYTFSDTQEPYRSDKTEDNTYFILVQAAIARELIMKRAMHEAGTDKAPSFKQALMQAERSKRPFKEEIILSTDLPPSHLSHLKDRYTLYLSNREEPFSFTYNDIPFEVTVKEVMVWAQGFAALLSGNYFSLVKKELQSVLLDIGGYTTEAIPLIGGEVDLKRCQSFELGVIHLYNEVSRRVMEEHQRTIPSGIIEGVLKGKEIEDKRAMEIIFESTREYAGKLIRKIKDNQVDLDYSIPVLIGGGSLLMKNFLVEALNRKDIIYIDDVRANAMGCEKCAYMAIKRRKDSPEAR